MSNIKVLIEVRGGTVTTVCATQDIDILIVDWDNIQNGSSPIGDILGPDANFEPGKAHTLFTDSSDPEEMEVRDILKYKKF